MNQQKLTDNWRKIRRKAQDSQQLAEVEVLQQTSERTLDELDLVIQVSGSGQVCLVKPSHPDPGLCCRD